MDKYIRERINDLRNYLAHIELFADRLPADVSPGREKLRVQMQLTDLYSQLAHATGNKNLQAADLAA